LGAGAPGVTFTGALRCMAMLRYKSEYRLRRALAPANGRAETEESPNSSCRNEPG